MTRRSRGRVCMLFGGVGSTGSVVVTVRLKAVCNSAALALRVAQ